MRGDSRRKHPSPSCNDLISHESATKQKLPSPRFLSKPIRKALPAPMTIEGIEPAAKKATLGEKIFGHAILILGCVLFPAFVTAIVPLSITRFTRDGGQIHATVSKHLLFVIPYRQIEVRNVIRVNDAFQGGTKIEQTSRRPGSSPTSSAVSSEDEAFLVIEGAASTAKVEVSPVNIRNVVEKTRDFLKNSRQPDLRLVTVANWKFGVFGGGLLSLLTLFYLYIIVDSTVRSVWKRIRGVEVH